MADPLSIVGTAAGLVSLGLQLYGGLSDYIDGVKCSREEIVSAARRLESFKDCLHAIEEALPGLHSLEGLPSVIRCIQLCEEQMVELATLLGEVMEQPLGGQLRDRIARQKQKLVYPFRRDKLRRLEDRLNSLNSTLSTAIQGLHLHHITKQAQYHNDAFSRLEKHFDHLSLSMTKQESSLSEIRNNLTEVTIRLTSKPALFREVVDDLALSQQQIANDDIKAMNVVNTASAQGFVTCSCKSRKSRQSFTRTWNGCGLYSEVRNASKHHPNCPLAFSNRQEYSKDSGFQLICAGKAVLIGLAISLRSSYGAGGFAICPQLRTYNVVDTAHAPLFQLIKWTNHRKYALSVPEIQQYVQSSIIKLFRERRAAPTDIDHDGQSLIAYLPHHALQYVHLNILPGYLTVLQTLHDFGVPLTTGKTKIVMKSFREFVSNSTIRRSKTEGPKISEVIKRLYSCSNFMDWESSELVLHWISFCHPVLQSAQSFSEFGYDAGVTSKSLSYAIMSQSPDSIRAICRQCPSAISETILGSLTPLHLSVFYYPPSLRIFRELGILKGSHANLHTRLGKTVLEEALVLSGERCKATSIGESCHDCNCADSVSILLESDCAVLWRSELAIATSLASFQASLLLLTHLRNRRESLKWLALDHLSWSEGQRLGLHSLTVLDGPNLISVSKTFEEHGYTIPNSLHTHTDEESDSASVYAFTISVSLAERLWSLGFTNINVVELFLRLQLDLNIYFRGWGFVSSTLDLSKMEYIQWLLDKDNALSRPVQLIRHGSRVSAFENMSPTNATEYTLGHWLAFGLGKAFRTTYDLDLPLHKHIPVFRGLLRDILELPVCDSCECFCSEKGCRASTKLFYAAYRYQRPETSPHQLVLLGYLTMAEIIEQCYPDRTVCDELAIQYIRSSTFEALGCVHTCCENLELIYDPWYGYEDVYEHSILSSRDKQIIWEEDKSNLDLLDELMEEFSVAYRARALPLSDFHDLVWLPRIQQIESERESATLSEEDWRAAREMGVSLTYVEAKAPETNDDYETWELFHENGWEEKQEGTRKKLQQQKIISWKSEIDSICEQRAG